jgi:hypothetical protein
MGLRFILHVYDDYVLTNIDIKNAYTAMRREAWCATHYNHDMLTRMIPYWRAKLGPHSPVWAGEEEFWGEKD